MTLAVAAANTELSYVIPAILVVTAFRVAWVDCRRWQIEFESLACVAIACGWLRVVEDGVTGAGLAAILAVTVVGIVAGAVRLGFLRKPGDGDWPLLAVCFFLAVGEALVFALVLAVAGLGMSVFYSLRRRKLLFRSRFPLAPPALLAAVTAFFARADLPGGFW
ncbi:MAG: hypothetical protein OXG71_06945 [Rhodospirillales bacterium]|nr:hypothetical protein [Rhodospirillales bacterium]